MERERIDEHALGGVAEMEREHALEIQMVRELQAALAAGDQAAAEQLFDRLQRPAPIGALADPGKALDVGPIVDGPAPMARGGMEEAPGLVVADRVDAEIGSARELLHGHPHES